MKFLILGFLVLGAPFVQAATCKPTGGTQRWAEGSVSILQNASQALYQIRATGPFLTADLICSMNDCVGFVGGVRVAKGTLEFTASGPLEPVGFIFETQAEDVIPSAAFVCN